MSTRHDTLAHSALRAYCMRASALTFLGHSDSITYRVQGERAQTGTEGLLKSDGKPNCNRM
jgi:hypothetical protein